MGITTLQPRARPRSAAAAVATLLAAGLLVAAAPPGAARKGGSRVGAVAAAAGVMRARPPQPGDVWRGCNDARAAGTAPIFAGEPGYRPDMDGDGDGIACEPYRRR